MEKIGQNQNWILRAAMALAVVLALAALTTQSAPAQTFTVLDDFNGTNGSDASSSLLQATNGNLYGTTAEGGGAGAGSVYQVTPGGTLTSIYSFCLQGTPPSDCPDGYQPLAPLVQASNGDLYGTTLRGGANNEGTVFKITTGGMLTTVYSFCSLSGCVDGIQPQGPLFQASNGNLYGTTSFDGANSGWGTIFKMTLAGKLTTIVNFAYTPGGNMPVAGLIEASNGDLYGMTPTGGGNGGCTYDCGTVFKITAAGKITYLHGFCSLSGCADGGNPEGALVQASNGNFYGTTSVGGANGQGTVFEITPAGKLTTLYSFCSESGCADGSSPRSTLIQATDGNLYGTTEYGGNEYDGVVGYCFASYGCGTIFEITSAGKLTTLYSFCAQNGCTDGYFPPAGLTQDTNGIFYGTAPGGGNVNCPQQGGGCGTLFSLSTGLGPFVALQTTSGKEGAKIGILGQGFSDSSVVEFGGTAASTIAVTGTTFITATVPAGALTGSVTVTTGSSALTSSRTFNVLPTITSIPSSGSVGTPVAIEGTGLTQTTKVTFGGVKATSFTANSDTQVTAYVPTGAKTGKIAVTTQGGSATSKTTFTVN
ncbi:MAG: choice-of-anchor tandem repeat GloVer-containing protein [Terriglobales bacterium]